VAGVVQHTKIRFDEKFKFADVYADGKWTTKALENGALEVGLLPGDAAYVLIY
jgi:hypothetical protein